MYRCITFKNIYVCGIILIISGVAFDYVIKVDSKRLRVFDGQDAERGEYPYVVALAYIHKTKKIIDVYKYFCTGSVIAPAWTLTAGHCIYVIYQKINIKKYKLVIRYVNETDNLTWYTSTIVDTIIHPTFHYRDKSKTTNMYVKNDIALVKTEKTMISEYGRLSAVDYRTMFGHEVTAAGYGNMNTEGGLVGNTIKLNRSLQVMDAAIIKCHEPVHPVFCLSWECEYPSTLCGGDSGAPIIHPTGIIAVHTAGTNSGCRRANLYASMSTPISQFIDWIANNIGKL